MNTTTCSAYQRLIEAVKALPAAPTAVAHPCNESALVGAVDAAKIGIIVPILVGPRKRILAAAEAAKLDISAYEIVDAEYSHDSATKAVALVREGRAEMLMKGSLSTDELLGAVVSRDGGLRTERRLSHCFIMDVPNHPNVLIITDAAINIFPTLAEKVDIVQNAIDLGHALRIEQPKVAILSAMEKVNPGLHPPWRPPRFARWRIGARSPVPCWTDRSPSTTPSVPRPPRSRILPAPWQATPTSWWSQTSKPATCSRRA